MEANQLTLYNHFVDTKQKERAAEILRVYPDFAVSEPEKIKPKGKK